MQLETLKAVSAFGQDFSIETGASPEWLFKTDVPQAHGGGKAVVKVWSMPYDKVNASQPASLLMVVSHPASLLMFVSHPASKNSGAFRWRWLGSNVSAVSNQVSDRIIFTSV